MEKQTKLSKTMIRAREYEETALKKGTALPKQLFHVCSPIGWINDPNGFSEYEGEYHLFFQYHPYSTSWGPMHWGHVRTKDFIQWQNLPVALAPDKKYDAFGCFSGSAITWNGKHVIAYTGVQRIKDLNGQTVDYQTQCMAVGDGIEYHKLKENPVITKDLLPEGSSELDFRDPKIWAGEDGIYMVVGNRSNDGSGQILMYHTRNLKDWEFVTILDKCNNRFGKMWECPDFFALDGQNVLVVSPQEMQAKEYELHAGDGTLYIIGQYDKTSKFFKEEIIRAVDLGLDFYAPQTMATSDGRRIMIAWMQAWCGNWFDEKDEFCGMMTIPRELSIRDGILCQIPVRELEQYYQNRTECNISLTEQLQKCEELSGREQNLDITLESEENYEFEIRLAADENYHTTIRYDKTAQLLSFDRSCSGVRRDAAHERCIKVLSNSQIMKLRIVMDRYSIEMFINDGQQAMTSVIRTPNQINGVYVRGRGNAKVNIIKHDIVIK